MSETSSGQTNTKQHADCLCGAIRECLQEAVEMLVPPESARQHFREARIELLRGIREIVDHRIERLSRDKTAGGTRIVVE